MRFLRVGDDGLLVEVAGPGEAAALFRHVGLRTGLAVDIVPAERTVLFDGVRDLPALVRRLESWQAPRTAPDIGSADSTLVEVPTTYDGPDLEAVARCWEMSTRDVIALHTSTEVEVAFCGFSPGFAYCLGLPMPRPVPRQESPRTRVAAGSVGLAGSFTGIYPRQAPGGWQLIGRTELVLWDSHADNPATLAPGVRVRFVEVV